MQLPCEADEPEGAAIFLGFFAGGGGVAPAAFLEAAGLRVGVSGAAVATTVCNFGVPGMPRRAAAGVRGIAAGVRGIAAGVRGALGVCGAGVRGIAPGVRGIAAGVRGIAAGVRDPLEAGVCGAAGVRGAPAGVRGTLVGVEGTLRLAGVLGTITG